MHRLDVLFRCSCLPSFRCCPSRIAYSVERGIIMLLPSVDAKLFREPCQSSQSQREDNVPDTLPPLPFLLPHGWRPVVSSMCIQSCDQSVRSRRWLVVFSWCSPRPNGDSPGSSGSHCRGCVLPSFCLCVKMSVTNNTEPHYI